MSKDAIYHIVAQIPRGRVATYGQVAALAGLGRGARLVGRTLNQLPAETELPWHRVINARGAIALPATSAGYGLQQEKLQQEGIVFKKDRVNLTQYGWDPS